MFIHNIMPVPCWRDAQPSQNDKAMAKQIAKRSLRVVAGVSILVKIISTPDLHHSFPYLQVPWKDFFFNFTTSSANTQAYNGTNWFYSIITIVKSLVFDSFNFYPLSFLQLTHIMCICVCFEKPLISLH